MSAIHSKPGSVSEIERLREENYNSTVTKIACPHEDLMILRVRPDQGVPPFLPGQYTVLGLGAWEPCAADTPAEVVEADASIGLIKRLYSISCSMLDDQDQLVRAGDTPYYEFYISRVRIAHPRRAALTPRLFALAEGSRLFCSNEPRGRYTLPSLSSSENAVFVATGTGEAPHNAMAAELLRRNFPGHLVSITCVRQKQDLAYIGVHRELERRFPNYRYLSLTTREPENLDPLHPKFVGKRYLQDYFQSGEFERDANWKLSPADTHVFLCGSPQMIGRSLTTPDRTPEVDQPIGMIEVLERRGFRADRSDLHGNIHTEKYW
jgi:ferredoxin--NADP+ reductase